MIIKRAPIHRKTLTAAVAVCCGLALVISGSRVMTSVPEMVEQTLYAIDSGISHPTTQSVSRSVREVMTGYIVGFRFRPPIQRLRIDMKPEAVSSLLSDRQRALREGILAEPKIVSARVWSDGKLHRAKIRLKGDLSDHWSQPYRMSLRVSLERGFVNGCSDFSLHKPLARQHPYDQAFQTLMRLLGNLSAPHDYVRIQFNGDDWGVMDFEEHMSNALLEKQNRKESIIVRFGNERSWKYRLNASKQVDGHRLSDERLYVSLYDEKKKLRDPMARMWLTYLEAERAKPSHAQIYDYKAYGRCLAATLFWGTAHTLAEENSRHYFNPYTLRLEPITTDQAAPMTCGAPGGFAKYSPIRDNITYRQLWSHSRFREQAAACVKDAIPVFAEAQSVINRFHSYFPLDARPEVGSIINANIADYQAHGFAMPVAPASDSMPDKMVDHTITIHEVSELPEVAVPKHYDDGTVCIYNLVPTPLNLTALVVDGERMPLKPTIIPSYTENNSGPVFIDTGLRGIFDGRIAVETELLDRRFVAAAGPTLFRNCSINPLEELAKIPPAPFHQDQKGDWVVPPGRWLVENPVTIHGTLSIPSGVTLLFATEACLIVKGRLCVMGTPGSPVVIGPSGKSWRGLYVLESNEPSFLSNVDIQATSALEYGLLRLTGGVTFYKSSVRMVDVRFSGTNAEDALNIVESQFSLERLLFSDTASDAFDTDNCSGKIVECKFIGIGGDAMDISGGNIEISSCEVKGARDKGISVGERSKVLIRNCSISDVGVGIACKDGSDAIASDCIVRNARIAAAMAYVKKPMYGSPVFDLHRLHAGAEPIIISETGSQLRLDGVLQRKSRVDVTSLYNGPMHK